MQEDAKDYFLSNKARFRQSEDEEDAADLFFAIKNMHRHGAEVEWDDTLLKMGEVLKQTKAELIETLEEEGEPEEATEVTPGLSIVDTLVDAKRRLLSRFRVPQRGRKPPKTRGIVSIRPLITELGDKKTIPVKDPYSDSPQAGVELGRGKQFRTVGASEISSRRSGDIPTTPTADLEDYLHDRWKPWTPWGKWEDFDPSVYLALASLELDPEQPQYGPGYAMDELIARATDESHPEYNKHPNSNKDMTDEGGLFPYLWWMIARDEWDDVKESGTGVDMDPTQSLMWNSESPAMLPSTYRWLEGIMDYDGPSAIRKVESGLRDVDQRILDRVTGLAAGLGLKGIKDTHLHFMRVRDSNDRPYSLRNDTASGYMPQQMQMSGAYEEMFVDWREKNKDKMAKNISKSDERLLFKNWFQLAFDLGLDIGDGEYGGIPAQQETNDWIFKQIVGPGKKPLPNYSWNKVRMTREFQEMRDTGFRRVGMPLFHFGLQFHRPAQQMMALAFYGMYKGNNKLLEKLLVEKDPAKNKFRSGQTYAELLDMMKKFETIWRAHVGNNLQGGSHTGQAPVAPIFQGDTDMIGSMFRDALRNAHSEDFSKSEWENIKEHTGDHPEGIRGLKGVDRVARSKKKELESYARMLRDSGDVEWNDDKGLPQSWIDELDDSVYDANEFLYNEEKLLDAILSLVRLLPQNEQSSAYHRITHWLDNDKNGLARHKSDVAVSGVAPYVEPLMAIIEGEYDVPRHDDVGAHPLSPTAVFAECMPDSGFDLTGPDVQEWWNLKTPPDVVHTTEDDLMIFDYANAEPPEAWEDCPYCEDSPGYVRNPKGKNVRCKGCRGNPHGKVVTEEFVDWLRSIGSAEERGGFSPIAQEIAEFILYNEKLENCPILWGVVREHIPPGALQELSQDRIVKIVLRARVGRLARKKQQVHGPSGEALPVSAAESQSKEGAIPHWTAVASGSGPDIGQPGDERPEIEGALGETPGKESVWGDDDEESSLTELRARAPPSRRWVWKYDKARKRTVLTQEIVPASPGFGKKPVSQRSADWLGVNFPGMDYQFLFGPEEAGVPGPRGSEAGTSAKVVNEIGQNYQDWLEDNGMDSEKARKDDRLARIFNDTEIVDRRGDATNKLLRKITLNRGHTRNIRLSRNVRTFLGGMYHKMSRIGSRHNKKDRRVVSNAEGDYMDDAKGYAAGDGCVRGGGHLGILGKQGVEHNKDKKTAQSFLFESGMCGFGKETPWTFEDAEGNPKTLISDPHGWARMHYKDLSQWLGGLKHPFGFGESVKGHLGLYDDEDWVAHPDLEYAGGNTGQEPTHIYLYKLENDGTLKMRSWKTSSADYRARDDDGKVIDEDHPDYDENIRSEWKGMVTKVPDLQHAMRCHKTDPMWPEARSKYFFTFIPEGTVNLLGEPGTPNTPFRTAGSTGPSSAESLATLGATTASWDSTQDRDFSRGPTFYVRENHIIEDPETGDKFAVGPHPSNIYAQYGGLLGELDRMEGGFRNNALRHAVMRRAYRLAPKTKDASQAKAKSGGDKRRLYTLARHLAEREQTAAAVFPFLIAHVASELYTRPEDYEPSEYPLMAEAAVNDYVEKYMKRQPSDGPATIELKNAMCRRLHHIAYEWGSKARHDEDDDGDDHEGFRFSTHSSARKKMLEGLLAKGFSFSDWQISNFLAPDWGTNTRFNSATFQPPVDIEPGSFLSNIMVDEGRDIEGINLLRWAAEEEYEDDAEHDIDASKALRLLKDGFSKHFSNYRQLGRYGDPQREKVSADERNRRKDDFDAIKEASHYAKGGKPLDWLEPSRVTPSGAPQKFSDTTEERVRRAKRARYSLDFQKEMKQLVLSIGSMRLTERHDFFRFLSALEPVMERLDSGFDQHSGFLLDHTFHRPLVDPEWELDEEWDSKKQLRLIEEYARLLFLRGRTAEDYRAPPTGVRDTINGRKGSSMWYGHGIPEEGMIDLDRGAIPNMGVLHHRLVSTRHHLPHDMGVGGGSTIPSLDSMKLPGVVQYPKSESSIRGLDGIGMPGEEEQHSLGARVIPTTHHWLLNAAISLPGADKPGVDWVTPTNSDNTGAMTTYESGRELGPKMDDMSALSLDILTDVDLFSKDDDRDKGKPIPVKAMHRIFDLSDLESLRGFSDDWVVTSWPDGKRVLVDKKEKKTKVYDSEGKAVSLPNKVKKDLLEVHDKDFLVDGIWDDETLHIVDILECGGNDLCVKPTRDRSRHLRSEFEATENVRTPAPVNTKRVDGEGLERAVKDLLNEKSIKQVLLRDAESTYMRGESRHPKWIMLTPEQQVDVRIVSSSEDNHLMGIGPIYEKDARALGNRSISFEGLPYMDVGTIQREGLEEGQYITVGVSGVSESTRNKYSLFRLISPRYKKESEGGATDSIETLDILNRRAGGNIPHRVRIKKGRIYIEVPTGNVVYETEPHGNAFILKDVDFPDDYTLRVVESQIEYWSPLAAVLLRSEKESKPKKRKEKIQEEPPANHDKKPKRVDEDQLLKDPELVKTVVIALEIVENMLKEKITWTGPKGLGIDFATPVESPHGPTKVTEPYDLPDHDPAHRQGTDGDCWCGAKKGEECKQGTGHKMRNCPKAHPPHKKNKARHLKVSQDSQKDSSV